MNDWRAELDRCVRCGSCRGVCPVFHLTRRETDTARGRLARLKEAAARPDFTAADRRALSRCLQCGRCVEVCKVGLDIPRLIQEAKRRAGAAGMPKLLVETVLTDPTRLDGALQTAGRLGRFLGRTTPDDSGLRLRFSLPYLEAGRLLPNPPPVSYLEKHTGRAGRGALKVALFTGCGAGRLFDGIGAGIDNLLASLDLIAAVPEQGCCGLPAWGMGATETARKIAASWTAAFSAAADDVILCPCASGTAHLQNTLPILLPETRPLAEKVEDLFVWLMRQDARFDLRGRRLAVHVPCHLRRGVRGGDAMTAFLRRAGAEIVALPPELTDGCCGMGGAFGAVHPRLSRAVGLPKVKAMLAAEPDAIVTNCTGCLLQLRDLVAHLGSATPVLHPAALFADVSAD